MPLCIWIWSGNGKYKHVLCVIISNRRVSMVPTWMLCNLYTYAPYLAKLCGNLFMTDLFILVLSPDLSTVREFLLKQAQLKCLTFGRLQKHTKDMFDTVKVLKCYSGISTWFGHVSKCPMSTAPNLCSVGGVCTWWGVPVVEVCQLCV